MIKLKKKPGSTGEEEQPVPPKEEAGMTQAPEEKEAPPEKTDAGEMPDADEVEAMPEEAPVTPTEKKLQKPPVPDYGRLNSVFNGLANIGPLAILLVLACMTWPMFWHAQAGVYCPAELKSLTAFLHCLARQSWLAPAALADGAFTLPQWPVFSWWIGLFALVPGLTGSGLLLPVATCAATFVAAFAVWFLAISAHFGRKAALAAAIILLCAPVFAPLPHFMGPAALAAGLMLLAVAFFARGWMRPHTFISLPLAFILTALAGLCAGLPHFAVPLAASLLFLVWRGNFRRAQKLDALLGFIFMLAIIGIWLGALMLSDSHANYASAIFADMWRFAWPLPKTWLAAVAIGLLGLLPWLLAIFGVSWLRVLMQAGKSLGDSRHVNGSALVWISLALTICAAPFVPDFHSAAIAIACLAAVLLGKAFINLPAIGNRFFFLLASLCMLAAGVIICMASFTETQSLLLGYLPLPAEAQNIAPKLVTLQALPYMGCICILAGLLGFFFVRRCQACGGLVLAILTVVVLCQPARLVLVPELAAMPETPLAAYASIENRVLNALKAPVAAPRQEPAARPAENAPAAKTEEPAAVKPQVAPIENAAELKTAPETPAPQRDATDEPPAIQSAPAESGQPAGKPAEPAGIQEAAPLPERQGASEQPKN